MEEITSEKKEIRLEMKGNNVRKEIRNEVGNERNNTRKEVRNEVRNKVRNEVKRGERGSWSQVSVEALAKARPNRHARAVANERSLEGNRLCGRVCEKEWLGEHLCA